MESEIFKRVEYLIAKATLANFSIAVTVEGRTLSLSGIDAQVWCFINGQRSVSEIREELDLSDIEVIQVIKRLLSLRLIYVDRNDEN